MSRLMRSAINKTRVNRSNSHEASAMALWTDPSRQYLITAIRNRPVLWDKNLTGDQNFRNMKSEAFVQVTDELNNLFPMCTKFSCEDVRSQWKNLKDTFVRKLRWLTEGKYSDDPTKEPTWKFYRMLTFLDEKESKRLGNMMEPVDGETSGYHDSMTLDLHSMDSMKSENVSQHNYEYSNHSSASSEEQMLQMFNQGVSPPSPSLPMPVSSAPCSTETICAKPPYTPQSGQDSDDEPRRKRQFIRRSSPNDSDEFELFGACIAAQLRRLSEDHNRGAALRLQKKLTDLMYADQMELLGNQ